ncbi:MAG: PP2C family protein-serine/threonine phosphatase [Candidatus Zhuqueibacterota bacterium]
MAEHSKRNAILIIPAIMLFLVLMLDVSGFFHAAMPLLKTLIRGALILSALMILFFPVRQWISGISIDNKFRLLFFDLVAIFLLTYFCPKEEQYYAQPSQIVYFTITAGLILILTLVALAVLRDLILIQRKSSTKQNYNLLFVLLLAYGLFAPYTSSAIDTKLDLSQLQHPSSWIHILFWIVNVLLIYFIVINSFRIHWVRIINKSQKVRSLIFSLLILIIAIGFLKITDAQAVTAYNAMAGRFFSGSLIFIYVYVSFSALIILLYLPTASVYDRKVKEISSLHNLSRYILGVFDLNRVMSIIIDQTVEVTGANYCWLMLMNEQSRRMELVAHKNLPGQLLATLARTDGNDIHEWILKNQSVLMIEQIARNKMTAKFDYWKRATGSLLGIPLVSATRVIGILYAVKHIDYGFLQDDRALMMAFANNASVAIENTRLVKKSLEKEKYEQELKIAHEAQMKLLPRRMPEMKHLDIDASCITANEVGGDYYDFFKFDDDRLAVVIGDVSGKGPEAAFYMAEVKGVIESLSDSNCSPKELLIRANKILYTTFDRKTFVSIIYGIFDLRQKVFQFCRAGHCPVLYWRKSDESVFLVEPPGLALGLDPGATFRDTLAEETIPLSAEDVFVFFTDGLNEARNMEHEEFEEHRLSQVVMECHQRQAREIKKEILTRVNAFTGLHAKHDDLTTVVVKIR